MHHSILDAKESEATNYLVTYFDDAASKKNSLVKNSSLSQSNLTENRISSIDSYNQACVTFGTRKVESSRGAKEHSRAIISLGRVDEREQEY